MSGIAATPFHAFISKAATVKQTTASASLSSSLSGVRLRVGRNCMLSETQTRNWRRNGRFVVSAKIYRGSRRGGAGPNSSERINPALDIDSLESSSVRLIDGNQNMVGIVSKDEAIAKAADGKLDLVILSHDEDPPVVRIMDYSKHMFERRRKKKEQQKKSSGVGGDIKEIKMRCKIEDHDYNVRLQSAQRFLEEGHKVKFVVRFKGREHNYRPRAIDIFERFERDLKELGAAETKNYDDQNMSLLIQPKPVVKQKGKPTNINKSENMSFDKNRLVAKEKTEDSPLSKGESVIKQEKTEVASGV